jgi:hypothetical protein
MCSILKQNPDKESNKEYPSNMGQKWTIEEENTLLSELDKNLSIENIALSHNRTTGGIIGKQRNIAYNMYRTNISIDEIIIKTKLNKEQITEIIARKENPTYSKEKNKDKVKPKHKPKPEKVKPFSLENEVIEIKNEIKYLKTTINELVEMMKAVYEFEDARI